MFRTALLTLVLSAAWAVPGVAQTTITSLSPTSAIVGGAAFTLNVFGTGFGPLMPIQWDGATQATTFVSSTHLSCTISAAMIAAVGPHNVRVRITALPPAFTNTVVFNVNNPAPVVTSMSPTSIGAGASGVLLIIGGSGFNSSTTVTADGTPLSVSAFSATNLNASVPGSMLALGDTLTISVSNPAPGGGTAAPQTLTVNNPVPTLNFVTPSSSAVGAGAVPITVSGSNFNAASVVRLDGANLPTTFVGPAQLAATIPAGTTAAAGAHTVSVFTPAPGGGTTPTTSFNVNNPVPTLASISPTTVFVGAPDTTVTFVGTNFNAQSVARRNGVDLATTFVSPTQLTAVVPAANLATFNTATLLVVNPAPGGGATAGFSFSAINHAAPTVSSLAPSSIVVQSAPLTVTVTGTGFDPFTVVRFNGVDCPTTFVSATTATAVFSGAQVSTPSVASIAAFNPAPGGGLSAPVPFTVGNPAPVVSLLQPNGVLGGALSTIAVFGSGFTAASVARVAGAAVTTNFVSAGHVVAVVPASMLGAIGSLPIDVVNPAPGGGTSAALPLAVTGHPVPTISSLAPPSATAVLGGAVVAVFGTGFSNQTTAAFDATPCATSFVSASQISVTIPSSIMGTPNSGTITVANPAPGGGVSNGQTFLITTPAPTLVSASPATLPAALGSSSATVILTGTGFHFLTQVFLDETPPVSLASVSGGPNTRIVTVPGSKLNASGTLVFKVSNPSPGGGDSNGVPVTVVAPVPVLTSVTPSVVPGGSPATTITLGGTGFLEETVVSVDGFPLPKLSTTSTQIQFSLPTSFSSASGTRRVRVATAAPVGGGSESPFVVSGPKIASANPALVPVLTPSSPPIVVALFGSFPNPAATVRLNGVLVPSTWISSVSMTCVVDGTLAATQQPGGFALTVVQQPAGLGPVVSNAFGMTVGVVGSPDNAGTVVVVPRPPLPNEEFFVRVEAPTFGQPLTLIADFGQTTLVPLVFDPTFDVVSGVLFGIPFPLADGLGLFGPPTGAALREDDLSAFGVPNPRGVFDLRGLVAPPVPFGLAFQLQAIYLDPAQPFGFNVTHVNPQSL